MSDLMDLYHQIILDHGKRPRNFRLIESADRHAVGYNPLCGDKIEVYVDLEDHTIRDIAFLGTGCAICTASASLMTQQLRGRSEDDARTTAALFRDMLTNRDDESALDDDRLGKLTALAGVRKFPMRVKCATLAWHTMEAALNDQDEPVSTE